MTSNIMIIDDSPIDRKIIRQILENRLNNVTIFEAESGVNINERLMSQNIHLCILDIMMPIKDGYQVLRGIKDDSCVMGISFCRQLQRLFKVFAESMI